MKLGLVGLLMCTTTAVALAQFGLTDESDIDANRAELEMRAANLPTDPTLLAAERAWVGRLLMNAKSGAAEIRQQLNEPDDSPKQFDGMANAVALFNGIECRDPSSSAANAAAGAFRAAFGRFSRNRSPFGVDSQAEKALVDTFDDPRFGWLRSQDAELTEKACQRLQAGIAEQGLKEKVKALASEYAGVYEKNRADLQSTNSKLTELIQMAEAYAQKLATAAQKVDTRRTIGDNLHWNVLALGLLGLASMLAVRLFPDGVMAEWVASGQVIQFVTVLILLSVILALGLAGIITENTLGTLLGGVAGYVLSQGVGKTVAREVAKASQGAAPGPTG